MYLGDSGPTLDLVGVEVNERSCLAALRHDRHGIVDEVTYDLNAIRDMLINDVLPQSYLCQDELWRVASI